MDCHTADWFKELISTKLIINTAEQLSIISYLTKIRELHKKNKTLLVIKPCYINNGNHSQILSFIFLVCSIGIRLLKNMCTYILYILYMCHVFRLC